MQLPRDDKADLRLWGEKRSGLEVTSLLDLSAGWAAREGSVKLHTEQGALRYRSCRAEMSSSTDLAERLCAQICFLRESHP